MLLDIADLTEKQQAALVRAGTPCRRCGSNDANLRTNAQLNAGVSTSICTVECRACGTANHMAPIGEPSKE